MSGVVYSGVVVSWLARTNGKAYASILAAPTPTKGMGSLACMFTIYHNHTARDVRRPNDRALTRSLPALHTHKHAVHGVNSHHYVVWLERGQTLIPLL